MYRNDNFEAFCHNNNIVIELVSDLSTKIRGYCYYDGNYYNVILNNKYCSHQLRKTTIHEIIHVMENHFIKPTLDIEYCENEVDHIVEKLYKEVNLNYRYI